MPEQPADRSGIMKMLMDRIKSIEQLADDIFRMTVESEHIPTAAAPGQFVNIKCSDGFRALLRRPISICSVDRQKGSYDLVFQRKGEGTGLLAEKKPGDMLDVIGPLGKGFDLDVKYGKIAVVGGGIGVFPLLFLLQESRAIAKYAYLGFRTKKLIVLEDEFKKSSTSLKISTDDGSNGVGGFVTDMVKSDLDSEQFDIIYTCGPVQMIKNVVDIAGNSGIRCQVSLEQRMGCGFGTCLVCVCKTRAQNGGWQYSRVCKDGPVFDSSEIIFE